MQIILSQRQEKAKDFLITYETKPVICALKRCGCFIRRISKITTPGLQKANVGYFIK